MKFIKFLLTGIVFGIVMAKSEAFSWYRIQEMFRFQAFHMYGIIGTAVVLGVLGVALIKKLRLRDIHGNPILFHPKEKSVVRYLAGGTLFGLGWALAGSCPGPMVVNIGYGYLSLALVFASAILGTFVYGLVKNHLPHCSSPAMHRDLHLLRTLIGGLSRIIWILSIWVICLLVFVGYFVWPKGTSTPDLRADVPAQENLGKPSPGPVYWSPPEEASLAGVSEKEMVQYGRDLIANTAVYFGPKGKLRPGATNGMNCQNCHLDAGTRVFGNNYSAVASTYPKYRARSGTRETMARRVNDCFERSLNGEPLDTNSKEMLAILAYIRWLGKDVPKGQKPAGSGLVELEWPEQAADPVLGASVYASQCALCHGKTGAGQWKPDRSGFLYPPLWGKESYNVGAGLYRLSNFARYVKANMPLGAKHDAPVLSDEEAWNLAAFVNSQMHPALDLSKDWPKPEEKPVDHPFGPFADGFDEKQHKLGPFKPILAKRKSMTKPPANQTRS
jgi:thiosulfate dehydrogenase